VQFLAEQLMKNAIVPPGFREDGAKPCCFAGCKRPVISCELQRFRGWRLSRIKALESDVPADR
jgi:hypothetical protein